VTDTVNTLAAFLDALSEHGWTCQYPKQVRSVAGIDDRIRRVVVIEGKLWNVPQMAYLCKDTGYVMMMGSEHDVGFSKFLEWLKSPVEPKPETAKKSVLAGQKSLFGDE